MSRLLPLEGLLLNLKQEIPVENKRVYITKERAYELLKEWTGEDFGIDNLDAWEKWVKENDPPLEE